MIGEQRCGRRGRLVDHGRGRSHERERQLCCAPRQIFQQRAEEAQVLFGGRILVREHLHRQIDVRTVRQGKVQLRAADLIFKPEAEDSRRELIRLAARDPHRAGAGYDVFCPLMQAETRRGKLRQRLAQARCSGMRRVKFQRRALEPGFRRPILWPSDRPVRCHGLKDPFYCGSFSCRCVAFAPLSKHARARPTSYGQRRPLHLPTHPNRAAYTTLHGTWRRMAAAWCICVGNPSAAARAAATRSGSTPAASPSQSNMPGHTIWL